MLKCSHSAKAYKNKRKYVFASADVLNQAAKWNETNWIESRQTIHQSTKKQKKNGQENMDDYVDKYV